MSPSIVTWLLDLGPGSSVLWIWKTHFQTMKVLSTCGMEMKIGLCLLRCNDTLPNSYHGFNIMSYQVLGTCSLMLMECVILSLRQFWSGRSKSTMYVMGYPRSDALCFSFSPWCLHLKFLLIIMICMTIFVPGISIFINIWYIEWKFC